MIKIFTLPFSTVHGTFFEDEVNRFLLNKKVNAIKAEFFICRQNVYWSILVDYNMVVEEAKSKSPPKLDEKDGLLLKRLKEWRKERAEIEGIPVYIIATNAQLLAIVRLKPRAKEGIKQIKGFGEKKIGKYGDDVLNIVAQFQ
jgi:superfamily II DNA helicase RecQ